MTALVAIVPEAALLGVVVVWPLLEQYVSDVEVPPFPVPLRTATRFAIAVVFEPEDVPYSISSAEHVLES